MAHQSWESYRESTCGAFKRAVKKPLAMAKKRKKPKRDENSVSFTLTPEQYAAVLKAVMVQRSVGIDQSIPRLAREVLLAAIGREEC